MEIMNATDVRKNWSITLDSVVHERPAYIKRTRDSIALIDINTLNTIFSVYKFKANRFKENDGSITLSTCDMDLVVNAGTEEEAVIELAREIKSYAEEYYKEFALWSSAPNRKDHVPYVLKALSLDEDVIKGEIVCQDGKN